MPPLAVPSLANASFAAIATPENVTVSKHDKELHVTVATGETFKLYAERLRMACRCAKCARAPIDGAVSGNFTNVTIVRCVPIGQYGINIVFSDGHTRNIFPWIYLSDLGA